MSTVREVEMAFNTALQALQLSPLVMENDPRDVEGIVEPFYRVTSMPGTPTRPGVGAEGNQRHIGIFQVDVFWPRARGDGEAKEKADEISAHFPVGSAVGPAVVTNSHRMGAQIVDVAWYMIPVQVTYRVDSVNQEEGNG